MKEGTCQTGLTWGLNGGKEERRQDRDTFYFSHRLKPLMSLLWSFTAILCPVIGWPGSSKTPGAGPPCRKVAIDLQRRWEKTPGLIWEREGGEVNIEMERESDLMGLV